MRTDAPISRATFTVLVTLPLLACLTGCPHRAPAPEQGEEWYRKENLFASFDAGAADLSLPNAYLLELACYIGDRGTFEVDRTLQTWGFDRRRDFRDLRTSTYGYVASNDRMVLVTFGGTDFMNVRDLLSDVDALQLVYDERYCRTPEARVHRGFRDSLNSVIDGVIGEVKAQAAPATRAERRAVQRTSAGETMIGTSSATTRPATRPATRVTTRPTTRSATRATTRPGSRGATSPRGTGKKLFIAGHSRGGAFAVLAAAAYAAARERDESLPELGGVYTFGQPRVGNGPFVEAMDSADVRLFRFVHRDDPIPDVPPAGLLSQRLSAERLPERHGYQHGGVAVHLRADGRVVKLPPGGTGGASLTDPRAATVGIASHYQAGYHEALYAALSNPETIEEPAWRATISAARVGALPAPTK